MSQLVVTPNELNIPASKATTSEKILKFPSQIKYIIGNEAAERFSYYGMRALLVVFMIDQLKMSKEEATGNYHMFISACYLTPLLGAYLSDRYLGKYKTIFWLSIVYCIGHAVLALFESKLGLMWGLGLIALGCGGIKPCVSAHVGDQFDKTNQSLIPKVYDLFYWSINFGAFFSILLTPWLRNNYGVTVAFAVPGLIMVLALWVFWLGRNEFVHVPPSGKAGSARFFEILFYSLKNLPNKKKGEDWLAQAELKYGKEKTEGARAALQVFKVISMVCGFWALFEQQGSTWVIQGQQMNQNVLGIHIDPAQIQAANTILVMAFIPLMSIVVIPFIEKLGIRITQLRKIGTGLLLTGIAFLFSAAIQQVLDQGVVLSIAWQFIPYIVITLAEILVSITGLEFCYTQAPSSMKSTMMSLWLLTITIGNLLTAAISYLNPFQGPAAQFYFYAGLLGVLTVAFGYLTRSYEYKSYIEGK